MSRSNFRDEFGKWIGDTMKAANPRVFITPSKTAEELRKYDARHFIDPAKMAERKEITDARVEGWIKGRKVGFNRGLAIGIGAMVLFYATVHALFGIFS